MSADGQSTAGSFPPSSSKTGVPTSAPLSATFLPTSSEPICESESASKLQQAEEKNSSTHEGDVLNARIACQRFDRLG